MESVSVADINGCIIIDMSGATQSAELGVAQGDEPVRR